MEKVIKLDRLKTLLDNFVPMEDARAETIMMQFPVFTLLFGQEETDESWLKSVTMEQLEFARDSLIFAMTEEDDSDEVTINDHRNPAFEYVYAREWMKASTSLTPVRLKPKFF